MIRGRFTSPNTNCFEPPGHELCSELIMWFIFISCIKLLLSGEVLHFGRVFVRFCQAPKSDEDAKAGVAVHYFDLFGF